MSRSFHKEGYVVEYIQRYVGEAKCSQKKKKKAVVNNKNIWSVDFGNFWYYHLHFKWMSSKTAAIHLCLHPA